MRFDGHFTEKDLRAQKTDEESAEFYLTQRDIFCQKRMVPWEDQMTLTRSVTASKLPSAPLRLVERYSVARNKYKPPNIRVLFIAESPPSSGGYFYAETTIGKDHLFRETMRSLKFWPSRRPMRKGCDKRSMLNEFRSLGFFLIDTCEFPVDKLRPTERRISTLRGALTLPGRVGALCPDRILIVKKTVFKPALQALSETDFAGRVLNTEALPFPSHGNQKKYRTMLRRLLKKGRAGKC